MWTTPFLEYPRRSSARGGRSVYKRTTQVEGRPGSRKFNGKTRGLLRTQRYYSDPNISINELGVPEDVAKNLTFPDIVTPYNKELLQSIVRNGYNKYPGAKSIKRKVDGKIISLKVINSKNLTLELGDIVNRHLIDGDIVLFNRQPSLHKMSMMGHRIKVLPYKTFRLNVSVTTPYNADFDGDEMNMHVPQSIQTSVELENLALVQTQIITPAQHKPIIALVQDSIIGSYLFTRYDNLLRKTEVLDLLAWVPSFTGTLPAPDFSKDTPQQDLLPGFPSTSTPSTDTLVPASTCSSTTCGQGRTLFL